MTTDSHREPAYGAQMATYFRLPKASSLVIQPVAKSPIAITRLVSEMGLRSARRAFPVERAFVVSMHLTQQVRRDVRSGSMIITPHHEFGLQVVSHFTDLEANPRVRNRGPVDWVHYHIPARHSMRLPMTGGFSDRIVGRLTWHGRSRSAPTHAVDSAVPDATPGILDPVSRILSTAVVRSCSPKVLGLDERSHASAWRFGALAKEAS